MSTEPTTVTIATGTHGRFLVDAPRGDGPWPVLMGFHGYGETASAHLQALVRLDPQHQWLRVSVQGLHRFYNRAQDVVASWMTREDRDLAIADNLAYADAVRAAVTRDYATRAPLIVAGFSQGAAQAYRTLRQIQHRARLNEEPTQVEADQAASEQAAGLALWTAVFGASGAVQSIAGTESS